MIHVALLAGTLIVLLLLADAVRGRGNAFVLTRAFVAGAWALGWLAYGFNVTGFPAPAWTTIGLLLVACAGSILMVPSAAAPPHPAVQVLFGRRSALLTLVLAAIAVFVVAWDLWFIASRISDYGASMGLKIHRLDRVTSTGAFALPGIRVMRALAMVVGALAFARWTVRHHPVDLGITALGMLAALLSTGRWEVVNYAVWLFMIAAFVGVSRGGPWWTYARLGVFGVLLAVFFVAHGQAFDKNVHAAALARLPEDKRVQAAGSVIRTEAPPEPAPMAATPPSPPVTVPLPPATTPRVQAPSPPSTPPRPLPTAAPIADATEPVGCHRWEEGLAASNRRFRALPSSVVAVVLYASGPFAAFDRVLCEGTAPVRQVIFYWPHKLARAAGLRPPESVLGVDPYVDIGIPFNNFSVIYPFVTEIGPLAGPLLWVGLALFIRFAAKGLLAMGHPALVVCATAPLSMAIRTPWVNTFFDGTLVIWVVVAGLAWWTAQRDGLRSESTG